MDAFDRSTKQIASKYKDNLTYWYKPHYLRRWKLWLFLLAVGAAFFFAFVPHNEVIYSTGPVSQNHSTIGCADCHEGGIAASSTDLAKTPNPHGTPEKKGLLSKVGLGKVEGFFKGVISGGTSLSRLDQACNDCHQGRNLHMPQAFAIRLAPFRQQITGARLDACSQCHREHEGAGRMPDPANSECVNCHYNVNRDNNPTKRLDETWMILSNKGGKKVPDTGMVATMGDDPTRRFIPPRPPSHIPPEPGDHLPVAFKSFADGHPDFGYQTPGVKDPGAINFNHVVHLDPLGKVMKAGKRLECGNCHKPGDNGDFMLPIIYEVNCAECHSLHFTPDMPELKIPHRAPAEVIRRTSSAGLTAMVHEYGANYKGLSEGPAMTAFINQKFAELGKMFYGPNGIRETIFNTGYPPGRTDQAFPGCIKCHIKTGYPKGEPETWIAETNLPQRWLTRGPFTHARHTQMDCVLCHAQALSSSKTADILLPTRESCALCHRPRDVSGKEKAPAIPELALKPQAHNTANSFNPELTLRQYQGGVPYECQYCHKRYHSDDDSAQFVFEMERKYGPAARQAPTAP